MDRVPILNPGASRTSPERDDLISHSKWNVKRYRSFLRKSYQLKVKPSIIRATGAKRTMRLPNRIRTSSSSSESVTEAETYLPPGLDILSMQDLRNSPEEAINQAALGMRITPESTSSVKDNLPRDSIRNSCQSFSQIFRESWRVLTEGCGYPDASNHDSSEETDIDVTGMENYTARNCEVPLDECTLHFHSRAASDNVKVLDDARDAPKAREYSFDKYKLVCPNQVMGKTGTLS